MKKNIPSLTSLIALALIAGTCAGYASDLPGYYDWRLTNPTDRTSAATNAIVGPVLFQNPFQICWTFATVASLESTLNLKLQAAGLPPTPALSQRYLSWLSFAPPLNGSGDGFFFYDEKIKNANYAPAAVFDRGGTGHEPVSTLVRYGAAYASEYPYTTDHYDVNSMAGVSPVAGRGTALHDVYALAPIDDDSPFTPFINKNKDYYKKLIQDYGLLCIDYYANEPPEPLEPVNDQDILTSTYKVMNHAVALVGWDDSYTMVDKKGVTHTGAWLLRNSWSEQAGEKGYFYLSYDDATAINNGVWQAETDWGRYTAVNTIAPSGEYIQNVYFIDNLLPKLLIQKGSYKTADKLTSGASQLLKAVGIFVPADDMSYTIEVSLTGDTPANTKPIYKQSGTFGQDGTAAYKGYRTVDFNQFIYLPAQQKYFITVTLTGTKGEAYYVPVSADKNQDAPAGVSYLYDPSAQKWIDTNAMIIKGEAAEIAMPLYALNKYSNEANGGDFTVVSLNDNGTGGSEIYLGKKDELYTTDFLHPTGRYTLSNMTVDLTKGLTDSWYGGVISGEGAVTKTGDGLLALSGANTYTGATNVNEGSLALTGSLHSPVTVATGATLTGTGTIDGSLTNKGNLVPGLTADAQSLLGNTDPIGTLTVTGDLTSSGALQISLNGTRNSQLAVGGTSALNGTALSLADGSTKPLANYNYTYLTSQGGITGNATAGEVLSPYLTLTSTISGNTGLLMAKETTPLGSLDGMSDSERSVGHALSGYQENSVMSDAASAKTQTLNDLFYQNGETSCNVMKQLTSSDRARLINVNPLSAMTTGAVYDRLDRALYDGNVNVAVPMNSFDGVPASMQVSTPVTLDLDYNFWFKLLRGFEYYGGTDGGYDLHNKSFGGVIGYDKAVNATTRLGGLFSYAKTDYNTDVMSGDSHDWRIGVYASHDNGTWKTQGMLSYGQNRYDFNRYIPYYGDKLSSDYDAKVFDIDAKVTYLPQENRAKSWQVAPYGRLSYTHASQGAYTEEGSSVFAQDMDSASNSSFRAEAGVEWKHQMDKTSSWGGSIGYKRILSGANPELNGTFAGDANGFTLSGDNDKNYVTYSVNLNKNTGNNWTVQGELRGEMSGHNHSEVYSLMAKHAF